MSIKQKAIKAKLKDWAYHLYIDMRVNGKSHRTALKAAKAEMLHMYKMRNDAEYKAEYEKKQVEIRSENMERAQKEFMSELRNNPNVYCSN